jgi:hypothetical protein
MEPRAEELERAVLFAQRCLMLGDAAGAEAALRAVMAVLAGSGRPVEADYVRLLLVSAAVAQGDLDQAETHFRGMSPDVGDVLEPGALDLSPRGCAAWEGRIRSRNACYDDRFFAAFYLAAGRYCSLAGHYGLALKALRQGLQHGGLQYPALGIPFRLALSSALLEKGDMESALDELVRLRSYGEAALNYYWPAVCELWSVWFVITGQYGASVAELRESVGWLERENLQIPRLRALLNLANVHILAGQFPEASSEIELAGAAAARLGDEDLKKACDAIARFRDDTLRDLLPGVRPIAALWGSGGGSIFVSDGVAPPDAPSASFLSKLSRAVTAFRRRLGMASLQHSRNGLAGIEMEFGHSDSLIVRAELEVCRAMLEQATGNFDTALRRYGQVCPGLVAAGLRPRLCVVLRLMADCERKDGRLTDSAAVHLQMSRKLLDQVRLSLPWPSQAQMLMSRWRLTDSYLESLAQRTIAETPELPASAPQVLELLRLSHRSRRLPAGFGEQPPGEGDWLPSLDSGSALLCFLVFGEWSAAISVAGGRAFLRRASLTTEKAREYVAGWHWAVRQQWDEPANLGLAKAIDDASMQLARDLDLDAVLAGLPSEIRHLRVIADGALRNIPVAAWRTGSGYLAGRYATSLDCGVRREARRVAPAVKIVGAPVSLGAEDFRPPGEVAELAWMRQVDWIRRLGTPLRLLEPAEISGQIILDSLSDAGLFHFVGHGAFDPDYPEKTGLVLIRPGAAVEILPLARIARSALSSLQHATITACCGADSYALPGRNAIGIAEAFCRAGAASVLASMWPAEPAIADRLTRTFTAALGSGRRDEALQRAQLDMIESGHPVVDWAGWSLLGEPGALDFRAE